MNKIPKYTFKSIEKKWQKQWLADKIYQPDLDKAQKPFFNLMMFPYPSAEGLHVGNMYAFTGVDVYGRFKKMQGYDVFEPIGLDGFGIHSENYAIKIGQHISDVSKRSEKNFYRQLHEIGNMYDWSRTVETYKPDYYKWTQWIFLKMYEKGLAYRKLAKVNWCPSCKTVLSDEQVIAGLCERCDSEVQKKELAQWFFKITDYAERLLKNLDWIDWPEDVKTNQRNWIGKSEGAKIKFKVVMEKGIEIDSMKANTEIEVFTTRPDTLFGATYLVVAPEHPLIAKLKSQISNLDEVESYVQEVIMKSEQDRKDETKEKTGVVLKGIMALNPATKQEIPIWVADYVLGGYGTGAIMAVPAHDERDFEFAKKFHMPIIKVVQPKKSFVVTITRSLNPDFYKQAAKFAKIIEGVNTWKGLTKIYSENIDQIFDLAEKHFTDDSWYIHSEGQVRKILIHAKNGEHQRFNLDNTQEMEQAIQFGLQVGIKKEQLDFSDVYAALTEEGQSINSDFLNGLDTHQAKEKINQWLENNHQGQKAVDFKLRDWCISRQRYWGPPIPVVWCRHCALKQKNIKVLMIHGFESSGQGNWFPWMKKQLEKLGCEVFAPSMTTSHHPNLDAWMDELKPYLAKLDENSIIISHSLGSKAAVHLLENSATRIDKLFLVASAIGNPRRDWSWLEKRMPGSDVDSLRKFWETKVDWAKVDSQVKRKFIILSNEDGFIDPEHYQIPNFSQVKVEKWDNQGHFIQKKNDQLKDYIVEQILADIAAMAVPVPEKALPVKLPPMDDFLPEGKGKGPLAKNEKFVHTKCPVCKASAERETDVSDPFVDSAWYFFRYPSTEFQDQPFDPGRTKKWLPVDSYIGGKEHTVLHLLYSRFVTMVFKDLGLIDFEEPYKRFFGHGLITKDGAKMSKSKGNVVNPDEIIAQYGADSVRLYLRFLGDFSQGGDWRDTGIEGMHRFIQRLWKLFHELNGQGAGVEKTQMIDKTIKVMGEDLDRLSFNTAVARLMEFVNWIRENQNEFNQAQTQKIKQTLALMLAPMAPHLAEEFWSQLGNQQSIFTQPWPEYDLANVVDDEIEIVVQINGKVRDKIMIPKETAEDQVKQLSLKSEKVKPYLTGNQIAKIFYVRGRLVSIVVK